MIPIWADGRQGDAVWANVSAPYALPSTWIGSRRTRAGLRVHPQGAARTFPHTIDHADSPRG